MRSNAGRIRLAHASGAATAGSCHSRAPAALVWGLLLSLCTPTAACGLLGSKSAKSASDSDDEAETSESSEKTAKTPTDSPSEEEGEGKAENTPSSELPTECANKDADVCTPSKAFAHAICQDTFPGVALYMFRAGTPWTRGYLRGKVQAWNASGGASVSGELEFDEEVLLLRKRTAAPGGMQVSGYGDGYDALRWNGSCVTLSSGEVTLSKPPSPKHAEISWRFIDSSLRDAMKHNDDKVQAAFRAYGRECKGATMGDVSDKCVKAVKRLGDAVVAYVRAGGELPMPEKVP